MRHTLINLSTDTQVTFVIPSDANDIEETCEIYTQSISSPASSCEKASLYVARSYYRRLLTKGYYTHIRGEQS